MSDGSLDSNQFQHILYLARYNKDQNADLVPIASTAIYPLALYSKKHTSLDQIPQGGQIAVAAINVGEALQAIQSGSPLRNLGSMSQLRTSLAPQLATFKEQGFDIELASLRGMAAPKGMPADVRAQLVKACLLYTSPSPRDRTRSRMPSSA